MKNLVREIHRRSLWQVLGIYLAGSWVALQVVEQLAEAASLPTWIRPAALALLVIGFPIVMATAFVQEGLSSKGAGSLAPTESTTESAEPASPARTGAIGLLTWRNAIVGGGVAFALWGVAVTVMMVMGVGPAGGGERAASSGSEERLGIAVLPFSNLGDDEQSLVLSLGIHDDLLTRLSKIASLRVTSRTSVMAYRDAPKPIPEIADELGVEYVLEGSVLGAGGQVNINAQLIDGHTDDHLWAETYNRALSVTNLFAIQKELAQRITESLSATLLPEEVAVIEAAPTEDLEAYNFYLRGHTYFQEGPRSDDFDLAIDMYQKAVELDPEFAEAHARLSLALGMKYEVEPVGEQETLDRALAAAERAFELDPDLPEASLAFGQYYYTGERNLDLALEHLTRAGQDNFHSADVFHLLGAVQRRKADLDGSIASFEELVRIDPLSAHFYDDLGSTYNVAARWKDAERALRRSMELAPRAGSSVFFLAQGLIGQGDLEGALTLVDSAANAGSFPFVRREIDLLSGRFDEAAARDTLPLFLAIDLDLKGDVAAARPWLDSALVLGEETIEREPGQALPHASLGWVYAALGRRDDALRMADRAIELLPVSSDFMDGPDMLFWKVRTLARLGDVEPALDTLEELIRTQAPGAYTTPYLALHPALDALRDNPRFDALLERNARSGVVVEGGP